MSFSKTISVCAALASIFGAGAAGWKLSQDTQPVEQKEDVSVFEEKINQLEEQLKEVKEQPQQTPIVVQQPAVLPPLPPVPEPKPGEFE
jgi:hypothetical protein